MLLMEFHELAVAEVAVLRTQRTLAVVNACVEHARVVTRGVLAEEAFFLEHED